MGLDKEQIDLHWAYIAGIIDGEGTLSIWRHKTLTSGGNHKPKLSAQIHIANISQNLIENLQRKIGGCIQKRQLQHRKPLYVLRVHNQAEQCRVIKNTLPYFIVKRQQAILLQKFLEKRFPRYHHFDEEDFQICSKMQILNKRGCTKSD